MTAIEIVTYIWCGGIVFMLIRYLSKIYSSDKDTLLANRLLYESYSNKLSVIGVLGTFVGITWGLLDFDSENLDASVPMLLNGLKLAFSTSILGMIGAYIINRSTTLKYNALGERDVVSAALKLSKTVEDLKRSIESNNTKILESAMVQIARTFQTEMEKVSTNLQDLMKKLIDKNFEELSTSINNLNTWQQENKNMVTSLTIAYKKTVDGFENASTTLSNITEKTKELVGEEGKLTVLIDNLHKAMVEDDNFVKISKEISTAASNLRQNSAQWQESLDNLRQWVEDQKGLNGNVASLITKLEDITKQKDFDTEFWANTQKGMNEAISIISTASNKLKNDLERLDSQFYDRLNTTLSNLDDCISGFTKGKKR